MITRTIAPTEDAVSLSTFLDYAGIAEADSSPALTLLLQAAQSRAESLCGSRFVTQTWRWTMNGFYPIVWLPHNPVQSITAITYIDPDGNQQTVDSDLYQLVIDNQGRASVQLQSGQNWPTSRDEADSVQVDYAVGYGDQADVPGPLQLAICVHAAHAYENREGETDTPDAFHHLLDEYRYYGQ